MKFLKIFLSIIVALAAIFFIGGMFLPKTYRVSRSINIQAPDTIIYTNISDFNKFVKWSVWSLREPSADIRIAGIPSQPGHTYNWSGEESGKGKMEIMNVQPFSSVNFQLTFTDPFKSIAQNNFKLSPSSKGTTVIWEMSGVNTNAMENWMGLFMDQMIGKDFEEGLKNLKQLSEKK
ncbi:SRPBCC family protein [Daejeonella oryzae]|uniref:SRPBCC family protein n=1 Tax=Daejeonella oryzae TaxID=1122943 RepID=UPI0003F79265|nr:SRPBCC family protein [Daejeonella oryzae]